MNRSRLITSATIALTMVVAVVVFNSFQDAGQEGPARAGVFSILGRVAPGDGPIPDGLWIRVTGQHDGRVQSVSVPLEPDGSFEARDLAPGFYTLRASKRSGGPEAAQELGSATALLTDADVTGIVIALKPPPR